MNSGIDKKPFSREADQSFLPRPRLDLLLENAMAYPALLVNAGAGYGKTHAVYSFLTRYNADTMWVQLSQEDNLVWRFWEHYTGAIAQIREASGTKIADLGFPETIRQFDRYMRLLYDETQPRKKFVTVFDDFHLIQDSAIRFFFKRILAAPALNAVVILISRTDPDLDTVSLLARRNLAGITMDELRFNREEIELFFKLRRIPLTEEELTQIHHDTGGWALAVDLISREFDAGRGDKKKYTPFLKSSFKKIEDELFAALDGDQQKFLIKLSLIDYWPLELLRELPGENQYTAELNTLTSFIRYDTYLQGCRIHDLFMDFLRDKQGELPVEEVREIYARAARWCSKNKLRLDAASYYAKAGDYQGLLSVINTLPRLPPLRVAAFLLEIIDRLFPSQSPAPDKEAGRELFFLRYIVRAKLLICLGRFDEATGISHEIIRLFGSQAPGPRRSAILAAAYNNLGVLGILSCRYTRDYAFYRWFKQAYRYYLENPETAYGQMSHSNMASYIIQVGHPAAPGEIERALNAVNKAIPYVSVSLNGCLYGADALAWAELFYYQDNLNKAEIFARQAVYQGREKEQYEVENRALFYLMRICIHSGNIGKIWESQKQLEAQLEIPEYLSRYTIHDIGMGRFYAQLGLTEKIAPWLRNEFQEGELNALFHNFNILVRASCFFAEKDYASALRTLGQGEERRQLESFLLGKLDMTLLEAAARYRLGEKEGALEILEQAWDMAASNTLDMPFIELGETMRLLAGAALALPPGKETRIPRPWLENIRNRASAYSKKLALTVELYRKGETEGEKPAVYLTGRERKILDGLAAGFNREEIAAATGLSFNEVKRLISSLYVKLEALNRADAIRIATAKGLLKGSR